MVLSYPEDTASLPPSLTSGFYNVSIPSFVMVPELWGRTVMEMTYLWLNTPVELIRYILAFV